MATEVKIPTPDQTTEEVRIVKWCKAPGQSVNKGEVILEIETDKAVMEVEASASGVLLKQLCGEEDVVPVGEVVGFIGAAGESIDLPAEQEAARPEPAGTVTCEPSARDEISTKASPVARKLAEKAGVDLKHVEGTGHGGKVTRRDVERYLSRDTAARQVGGRILASPSAKRLARELGVDPAEITGTGPGGRITGKDVKEFAETTKAAKTAQPQPGTAVPLTRMRRAIGVNLQKSSRDTPHFNITMSVDMTRALEVRGRLNQSRPEDKRISVNDLVVRACAAALKQYPAVNVRLQDDKVHYLSEINIGIATAVDEGLLVPVLLNADKLDWDELAGRTKQLAQQARTGKIIGAGKGTFTVSNLGMFGVDCFTAIINPPESAILAVGAVRNEVVGVDGGLDVRPVMKVTLCSDHRVIDGILAAKFLQSVKTYLEEQIVCS